MPNNLLDDYLNQVLDSFHRDRLPPIVREALVALPLHIIHCLQGCPSVSPHLSEPAFQSGPFARATDINVGLEMEVTVPVAGLDGQELAEFRQTVADCLRQSIPRTEASLDLIAEVIHLNFLSGPGTVLVKVMSVHEAARLRRLKQHLRTLREVGQLPRQSIRLLKCWAHCQEIEISATKLERLILTASPNDTSLHAHVLKRTRKGLPKGFAPLWKALQTNDLPLLRKELTLQP